MLEQGKSEFPSLHVVRLLAIGWRNDGTHILTWERFGGQQLAGSAGGIQRSPAHFCRERIIGHIIAVITSSRTLGFVKKLGKSWER
jgi:hypothetical protein